MSATSSSLPLSPAGGASFGDGWSSLVHDLLACSGGVFDALGLAFGPVDGAGTLYIVGCTPDAAGRDLTGATADLAPAHRYLGALRAGEVFRSNDVTEDPRLAPIGEALRAAGIGAMLVVPILHRHELVAVVCAHGDGPTAFTARHLETLADLAEVLAPAAVAMAEQHLSDARRELADLRATTRGIAHDMRNLLQVVQNTASVLERTDASTGLGRQLRSANRQLAVLLDRLGGAADGTVTATPRTEPLAVLEDLRAALAGMAAPHRLEMVLPSATPDVAVTRAELVQIVTNLAANACEAMGEPGTLQVSLAPTRDAFVRLSVTDGGPGVSELMRDRLFDPGATTHGALRGEGLNVVSSVLRRRAGRVEVESGPRGTTFHVLLPHAKEGAFAQRR